MIRLLSSAINLKQKNMKNNLRIGLVFIAIGLIFGCASASFAQAPRVGGYKTVSVEDEYVKAAADFAVKEYSEKNDESLKVFVIIKAERQVVQGSNYRLCIEVTDADGESDETRFAKVVVYQDLKRAYKLTSWEFADCAEDQ